MERITLEVDETVARNWNNASESLKKKAAQFITQLFGKSVTPQKGYGLPDETLIQQIEADAKDNYDVYEASLNKLRKTTEANGLTPETLERLLNG